MSIGKRIKELRELKGLTQEKLAAKLSITRTCLAMYETNKNQVPSDLVPVLARFFDVTTDYLFGLED